MHVFFAVGFPKERALGTLVPRWTRQKSRYSMRSLKSQPNAKMSHTLTMHAPGRHSVGQSRAGAPVLPALARCCWCISSHLSAMVTWLPSVKSSLFPWPPPFKVLLPGANPAARQHHAFRALMWATISSCKPIIVQVRTDRWDLPQAFGGGVSF